jgi:hypothetical protein
MVLDSIEKAEIYYEIHELYKYPTKCLKCNCNVKANFTRGLFECNCRFLLFDYECGIDFYEM